MPLFRRATPLLLAAALCVSARAGVVGPAAEAGQVFVYAPPAGGWNAPLTTAFSDPAIMSLLPPSLAPVTPAPTPEHPSPSPSLSPEALRNSAPLVQSLAKSLELTPAAFAAMKPEERKGAVELALEEVKESIRAKAYELQKEARQLSQPGRAMDRQTRLELYHAVSKLIEMKEHYGDWLDDGGRQAVADGYAMASARAWEVKNFLQSADNPTPAGAKTMRTDSKPAAPVLPPYVLKPSPTAAALRVDMQNNKSGWGQDDLHTLYVGYGFVLREGGKHRFYYHPRFPQLTQSVSRQNDLPPGYAQSALKLINELEDLVEAQKATAVVQTTGPPATLTLADLSILVSQPKVRAEKRPTPGFQEAAVADKGAPEDVRETPIPEAVPSAIADKTSPEPVTEHVVRLQPATPKTVELKPEPPLEKTSPEPKLSLIERWKARWGRSKSTP